MSVAFTVRTHVQSAIAFAAIAFVGSVLVSCTVECGIPQLSLNKEDVSVITNSV